MIGYNKNEIIGKMRERVILQNRVISQSDSGFQSETYSNIATLWTALDYKSGFEEEDADKIVSQQKINFTLRYNENITTNSRFVYRDSLYQIEKIDISNDRRFVFCTGVYRSSYTGSYELTIDVAASVNGSATISANVNSLLYLACQANASASTTATITKIIEVSSLVNANALLSGDINFVQKAQASLLATGTTTADLTVNAPSASLLLDLYPSAAAAYSLRKLRTAYTGSAVRVRASTSGAEGDVSFDVNSTISASSTVTITAVGTSGLSIGQQVTFSTFWNAGGSNQNVFVTTWYDQSGNANNATMTTQANQPQIVSSGSVILTNGKPSVNFDGTNDSLNLSSSFSFANTGSLISFVGKRAASGDRLYSLAGTNYNFALWSDNKYYLQSRSNGYQTSTNTDTSTNQLLLSGVNNGTNQIIYKNNSAVTSSFVALLLPSNINNIGNYANNGSAYTKSNLQEIIFYNSQNSSNLNGINTNINTHYAIY
jgi:SPP1 family predicted phage head-tail adaptor